VFVQTINYCRLFKLFFIGDLEPCHLIIMCPNCWPNPHHCNDVVSCECEIMIDLNAFKQNTTIFLKLLVISRKVHIFANMITCMFAWFGLWGMMFNAIIILGFRVSLPYGFLGLFT